MRLLRILIRETFVESKCDMISYWLKVKVAQSDQCSAYLKCLVQDGTFLAYKINSNFWKESCLHQAGHWPVLEA